ncbi:MAG: Jag N-terminal domain-containing protein [Helicobacteraceae bacterium]
MINVEAKTLDEAYLKAAELLNCSVTQLDTKIVQYPSGGFLGLFKKNAVIQAQVKSKDKKPDNAAAKADAKKSVPQPAKPAQNASQAQGQGIDMAAILPEIKSGIETVFSHLCLDLKLVSVKAYDEKTIEVVFDGNDAALMIGRDGYRYKALSYVLFNWVNPKYGVLLRLEVAQFLKNQEEMIRNYLEQIKKIVEKNGKAQTKILDGVLVQIALKQLRQEYPDKYVAIKRTTRGDKFIAVNTFSKPNE